MGLGMTNDQLIKRIQEVLETSATGEALIEIIRSRNENAKELASMYNFDDPLTIEDNEGAI